MVLKKAQAWGFDLIAASIIFVGGIVVFYLYALNSPNQTEETLNSLNYEGDTMANTILSEGYPIDWNEDNVAYPGILSDNKIDQTKLERFYNLSIDDYSKIKALFGVREEFYFYLSENFSINGNQIEGIGKKPSVTRNLVKITRFIVYNNKPVTFNLEIWN